MIQSVLIIDTNTRVVLNRISMDPDRPGNINLPEGQMLSPRHDGDIGWTLLPDNEWFNPNPPIPYPIEQKVRNRRDAELEKSDIYMIPDYPITDVLREQWRVYRQALRDITNQPGFPDSVVWPTKPE